MMGALDTCSYDEKCKQTIDGRIFVAFYKEIVLVQYSGDINVRLSNGKQ